SSRIAFVVSLLKGEALDWANAVWSTYERGTYTDFIRDFRAVFDHPDEGRETGDQLFQLQQGSRSVAQYALAFRTIAAGSGWNETALRTAYRNGLNLDIRKELAYRVDGLSLEELIALTIRLDQLRQGSAPTSRRPTAARAVPLPLPAAPETRPPPDPRSPPGLTAEEPMQVDSSRFTAGGRARERARRLLGGLCLYCGGSGHLIRNCSIRPQKALMPSPRHDGPTTSPPAVITYRPGTRNTKADALSRMFEEDADCATIDKPILESRMLLSPIRWEIDNEIEQCNAAEPVPETCPPDRLFVPAPFRDRLITWVHTSLTSGHPGETRTHQLLAGKYWWDSMNSDIHRFVTSCDTCSQCKTPRTLPAGKLMPLPIPSRPWSHIAVDFVTDLPESQGHTVILTVVDRFSRGVRFIPFASLPTAFQTAEALFHYVFRLFGIPEDIVSDRGSQFTSQVWSAFMERLGITVSLTSGYHPQSNGQCERMNQELGYQPPLMPWTVTISNVPSVEHWMRRSEEVWGQTHQRIEEALRRHKRYADRRRGTTPSYAPGDRVWLSTRDFRLTEGSRKLTAKYIGPFKIVEKVNDVTYKLELPAHYRVCSTFHVSLLKPVVPGPLNEALPADTPPDPTVVDGTPVYAVRRLLDSRRRGGVLQYLVDWDGFGPEERSWVSAADVLDPALIEDFHRRHPLRPAPRPRGRPGRSLSNRSGVGRLSGSPAVGHRQGCSRPFTGYSVAGPQGAGESLVPIRDRSGSVTRRAAGGLGGRRRGRPRSSSLSDSLGGGDVTLPVFPAPPALPNSTSQRTLPDDVSSMCSHADVPIRSRSPEF
ncbi:hypothetical protein NFI96_009880, partial [Prochilodus magdalenae]